MRELPVPLMGDRTSAGGRAGYYRAMTVNPIQVQKFLSGVDYPATKDDIVDTAQAQGADDDLLEVLRNLPMDQFDSPNDVSEAIGKLNDQ
ncbi:hypothetical protein GCM10010185_42970 [Saccharothrix coeruleofusca]|uniref:DUF2795 domain-containing protein n=2 Tax=Saccharothrix coeruleofusca TaxID=33919 RepID=A0A918EEI0_9PSEU|nr:hypothetical protein GCM10010185_42970 [Saccharothrix coeruleofusca]